MIKGKGKADKADARLHMVRYAQRHSNKESARQYGCSKNTVKLWLRRFKEEGMSSLNKKEMSPGIFHIRQQRQRRTIS